MVVRLGSVWLLISICGIDGGSALVLFIEVFFFFKQKTAYEMRISDWSSDVCSSELGDVQLFYRTQPQAPAGRAARFRQPCDLPDCPCRRRSQRHPDARGDPAHRPLGARDCGGGALPPRPQHDRDAAEPLWVARSEEPTSELQSLMRIS